MSVTLTNIQAMELARIASTLSMISPVKFPPSSRHVYVPIAYINKIRDQLTAAGIDWQAQAKAYREFLLAEKADK